MASNLVASLRLVLVTDDAFAPDLAAGVAAAVAGGVTAVQLRLKEASARRLLALLEAFRRDLPVPVLVNDRLDVALAGGAAGVHLGADDLPVPAARALAPRATGFWIGRSVGDVAEALAAEEADYWGSGPYRTSITKPDAGPALGGAGLAALVARAGPIPVVAIGGVRPEDLADLRVSGIAGVAVASGILGAADPMAAAARYRAAWEANG